jgi:alkylation response protein AidB-like acyl-CoA dehydrogenase
MSIRPPEAAKLPLGAEDLAVYARALERWLVENAAGVDRAATPTGSCSERVEAMVAFMAELHSAGWSRYGWPEEYGGLGGGILHRAVMWDALARHGVAGMAIFEQLEVLLPTLIAMASPERVKSQLPEFLAGREMWCQGFSEPGAGSDLASLRTRSVPVQDGYVITGRKIWTSWARYARWCLVLTRSGSLESRHRGLTAFIVDLHAPGVDVRPIIQANGDDELAEVTFDDVFVPSDGIVGEIDGGWAVAMHILAYERGTWGWFRHGFLYQRLRHASGGDDSRADNQLGDAVLDLYAVTAKSHQALIAHDAGALLGPRSAFTKLLLCEAEQSVGDWMLSQRPELSLDADDLETGVERKDYLFSRIVTVYGGSQQMQLHTIAKQLLGLS